MADKVIRDVYIDYDNFADYDERVMYHLSGCKTTAACILLDVRERCFKKRNGKSVPVLFYQVSLDSEDLLWITLTEPKIILQR